MLIELCTLNQIKSFDFLTNYLQYISTLLEYTSLDSVPTNLTDVQDQRNSKPRNLITSSFLSKSSLSEKVGLFQFVF